MADVLANEGFLSSNSGLSFFDFSWFLEAVALHAQPEAGSKALLLRAGPSESECTIAVVHFDPKSEFEAAKTVENRCPQGGEDALSRDDVDSECNVVEDSDLDHETSEVRRMFRTFDQNQDDLICAADLRRFMGRLGFEISEEEAVSMVAALDHDGDGNIGFEEFCTLYKSLDEGTDPRTAHGSGIDNEEDETLLEAFRVFDKNNDGFISCQELHTVLLALGLPEGKSLKSCELMIRGVDSDGNGEVDIQEFKQMMSSKLFPQF